MNMMSRNPNSDDEPHTLRSEPPSVGIPILRSPHLIMSVSNELQISQSPTACFIQDLRNRHSGALGAQAFSVNTDTRREDSRRVSAPSEASDRTPATNQIGSGSSASAETEKEVMDSKEESGEQAEMQEHERQRPIQAFSGHPRPPSHLTGSSQEASVPPCPPGYPPAGSSREASITYSPLVYPPAGSSREASVSHCPPVYPPNGSTREASVAPSPPVYPSSGSSPEASVSHCPPTYPPAGSSQEPSVPPGPPGLPPTGLYHLASASHCPSGLPPTGSSFEAAVPPAPPGHPPTGLFHAAAVDPSLFDHSNPFSTPPSNIAPPPVFVAPNLTASLKFFSFVILHVQEDQEEALRVRDILHSLEIGEGTTFCEGFETAGLSPLTCLEDAIENSAYIVLLLTPGSLSIWGKFQTNTALMNSIENKKKSGTVIPFISRVRSPGKIPLAVKALIPLDENSLLFGTRVRNTFKRETIEKQKEDWRKKQELRILERRMEDVRDLAGDLEARQQITADLQAAYADIFARFSSLMSILPPQPFLGQGPVSIQINNASNVQIGNQNSMNVQQTTNVPTMEGYQGGGADYQG